MTTANRVENQVMRGKLSVGLVTYVNSHPRSHFDLKKHLPKPDQLGEYNAEPIPATGSP
jgi:hypothetical protein